MALNEVATFLVIVGTILHIWVSRLEARRDSRADNIAEKKNLDAADATQKAKRKEKIVRYAMVAALILALVAISASILEGFTDTKSDNVANSGLSVVWATVNLNYPLI